MGVYVHTHTYTPTIRQNREDTGQTPLSLLLSKMSPQSTGLWVGLHSLVISGYHVSPISTQHPATHRNTPQHTATHCNTLQHTATHCNTLQHTAPHCNTLQHTATHCILWLSSLAHQNAVHCNTLQHTATHCITLQHTATRCTILQHTATHCNTLQHTATHCNTLHSLAIKSRPSRCNTLQHTATHHILRRSSLDHQERERDCSYYIILQTYDVGLHSKRHPI